VTAWISDEINADCIAAGMKNVLGKPVNVKQLWEVIMEHFYRKSKDEIDELRKERDNK